MIGPLFYPGRYPPSRKARVPAFARAVKVPIGWVVEHVCAPLARWNGRLLLTPEVGVPIRGLPPELDGYRIALVTDLHRGPVVPASWLARAADRVAELAPDLVALGGDFVSHVKRDLDGLASVTARPVPTRHSPVSRPRSPASCSRITLISSSTSPPGCGWT